MMMFRCVWICLLYLIFMLGKNDAQWISSQPLPNGKTYRWSNETKTWNDSELECLKNGWILAVASNLEDYEILREFVKDSNRDTTWIGLRLTNWSSPIRGRWSDGSQFQHNRSYWAPGEPRTKVKCVNIWKEKDYKLDDYGCNGRLNFVCEESESYFRTARKHLLNNMNVTPSNAVNLKETSYFLNSLLYTSAEEFKQNKNLSGTILTSFDDFLGKYQDGDYEEHKEHLNVLVKMHTNESMLLGNDSSTNSLITINLTTGLLNEARLRAAENSSAIQVGSVLYKSSKLFQINLTRYGKIQIDTTNTSFKLEALDVPMFGDIPQSRLPPQLLSDVLSAQISERGVSETPRKVNTSDLSNAVRITTDVCANSTVPEFSGMKADAKYICVFWNTVSNEWTTEGCIKIKEENSDRSCKAGNSSWQSKKITCDCSHMTHFAVILDTAYVVVPDYLDSLNIAGCSISAFFHLLTAVTILCIRQMRKETNKKIILNISINLFALNLIFLIGIEERQQNPAACKAASFILHYFLLNSWIWMLFEAVYLCYALFLKRKGYIGNDILVLLGGGIAAYVLSAVVAGITLAVSGTAYLSNRYCWLSSKALIYAVYVPIGCILGINIITLIAAIYKMTCGWKMKLSVTNSTMIRQTMRRIVYLIFLLGIPWGFGGLMLLSQYEKSREIFSALFAVGNMLQGLVIFVAFCGTDENFRKNVRRRYRTLDVWMQSFARQRKFKIEQSEGTNVTNVSSTAQPQKRLPFRNGWV